MNLIPLFIGIITLSFSFVTGVFAHTLLGGHGMAVAMSFYTVCFAADAFTTIRVRDFERYEKNAMFGILRRHMGPYHAIMVIFSAGIAVCLGWYVIMADAFLPFFVGMIHLCAVANNIEAVRSIIVKRRMENPGK